MANKYSASEIAELGVQIEKNGYAFYSHCAAETDREDVKKLFTFLAHEEHDHIAVFDRMRSLVQSYEPVESYPDDYFAYLHDLAAEHVFTQEGKGLAIAQVITNAREGIDMALSFERDSITFFTAMKKVVPSDEQNIIDQLIEQEKRHIQKLEAMRPTT